MDAGRARRNSGTSGEERDVASLTTRLTRSAALASVAGRLRCPHCGSGLSLGDATLRCDAGHAYDVARQGHVALPAPGGRLPSGDSEEMVAAREAFLGAGHYAPIVAAVAAAARQSVVRLVGGGGYVADLGTRTGGCVVDLGAPAGGCVVDLGAGTGHYLAGVLGELAGWSGVALDASRPALRRAVRADRRIAGVVCDAWRPLPVRDGVADVVLSVFAPRNAAEIARILGASGALVVVTPTVDHLRELVAPLGLISVDPAKPARLLAQVEPVLEEVSVRPVEFELNLDHTAVRGVAGMGPSAHHVETALLEARVAALGEPVRVTVGVVVQTFRRRRASVE